MNFKSLFVFRYLTQNCCFPERNNQKNGIPGQTEWKEEETKEQATFLEKVEKKEDDEFSTKYPFVTLV